MSEELIQGSDEWLAIRCGKVTASRVADVVARTKTGWGASRANYMAELLTERLTGQPAERYMNAAMSWGQDNEGAAREAYEWHSAMEVQQVGFVHHPTILNSGASPDGLVGKEGLVELKAPNTATHLETLLGQTVPDKYVKQMQWQMACTERAFCDFVSFDPRLPDAMRLFVQRIERDDAMIAALEKDVAIFLKELDEKIDALRARYAPPPRVTNLLAAG